VNNIENLTIIILLDN